MDTIDKDIFAKAIMNNAKEITRIISLGATMHCAILQNFEKIPVILCYFYGESSNGYSGCIDWKYVDLYHCIVSDKKTYIHRSPC